MAVEKYNNAPIDGGSSKLKLELIIDPSKKPLASRITANNPQPQAAKNDLAKSLKLKQKLQQKKKLQQQVKPKATKKKPVKRSKKSIEELDQEMADYFDN